jgi:DNA-binding transcriptional ArsR family regulator
VSNETNWRQRALQELTSEREECSARLQKLDVALEALRNLIGEEAADPPRAAEARKRPVTPKNEARKTSGVRQEILDALRSGPLSPANLASAIRRETSAAMYHVKKLASSGGVVLTGASNNRRVALSSSAAAKEGL